jgi:putative ABC transport system permease protein
MWKLVLRNVMRQRMRTAMTVGAIAAGVVSLVLSGGFVSDIFIQLAEFTIRSQLGHIQIYKEGYYAFGSQMPSKYLIEDPAPIIRALSTRPEIEQTMGRLNFFGLLNKGKADLAIVGEGIEPDKENKLGTYLTMVAGRQLKNEDRFGIVVGEGVAQSQQLKPGDQVTLVVNTTDGSMNTLEFELIGVFRSFSKEFDSRAVRIPLEAAQELMGSAGINSLVVQLRRTGDTTTIARQLLGEMKDKGYEIKTWEELSDFYRSTVALYDIQFGVLKLIILGMVLLGVVNSVNMSIFERVGEFGTMRALGDRNRDVFLLIMGENLVIGIIGAGMGLAMGVLLALAISAIGIPMPPPPNSNQPYTAYLRVVPSVLLTAVLIGLAGAVVAACWPAFRVSRTHVADSLRRNI